MSSIAEPMGLPVVSKQPSPTIAVTQKRPRRRRRWIFVTLASFILVAAASAIAFFLVSRPPAAPRARYETAPIGRGPIAAKVTATGVLSAIVTVQVGSQVSGRIDSLLVDFNSTVKKGDVVATIDPAFFRAAVSSAKASSAVAAADIEKARTKVSLCEQQSVRAEALYREGLIPKNDREVATAALATARAELRAAQASATRAQADLEQSTLNLNYTTIVSPIDGVVISRNVDVGQTVAATLQAPTLFSIAQDLRAMQLDTNVAEADVAKIAAGLDVSFTVDAYPGQTFHGKVRQVRNAAQTIQNVVTYVAVADVDNNDQLLRPGMTASAAFVYAEKQDVLFVPNVALRFRPDPKVMGTKTGAQRPRNLGASERELWVLRGDRPVVVRVRVGISDGSLTEVMEGDIQEGDKAITEATAL